MNASPRRTRSGRRRSRTVRIVVACALAALSLPLAAATLTVTFTNNGEPLTDAQHGRFYLYEPGEREKYVTWGPDGRTVRVSDGVYDLVVRYVNDGVERERTFESVSLSGDVVRTIDWQLALARLTVEVTTGGQPVAEHAGRVSLYRAGDRSRPLASWRPGASATVTHGRYDVEVVWRGPDELVRRWIEGLSVGGDLTERVEMGSAQARLTLTMLERGQPLAATDGTWRLYGVGDRETPVASAGSGESLSVPEGSYDIGLFYGADDGRGERWLVSETVRGDVERTVEVWANAASLTLDVVHAGAPAAAAWFSVHAVDDRERPIVEAAGGATVDLQPGVYDVRAFMNRGGVRAETWLSNVSVVGRERLEATLSFERASLRVRPPRRLRSDAAAARRVLLVVDSSEAMAAALGGVTRLEGVRETLKSALAIFIGTPVDVGLRTFGIVPREQSGCEESARLVALDGLDRPMLNRNLDLLRAEGPAALSFALKQAATDLPPDGDNTLLLITASSEQCGGDPCAAAARLVRERRAANVEVIDLSADALTRRRLECVGHVQSVDNAQDLRDAIRGVLRDVRRPSEGGVAVFRPGGGELVAVGALGERIELTSGTYDLLIRAGAESFEWPAFDVRGDVDVAADER